MSTLSQYELERLQTIKQNQARLVELGLETAAAEVREISEKKKAAVATEKKERQKRMPAPPTRVSKRIREEKPQYTAEKIDRFGDELDAKAEKQARSRASDEDKAAARAEAMEAARQMLEEARARATPAPTSTEMLLQEYYADDGWKLLVACALMSRVSSHETKTRCIEGFFALCPTPSAFLDTEPTAVEEVINALGLFDNRYRTLAELSTAWLEMPIFEIGLDKSNKIWGAGEFTVHSYFIFCKDDRTIKPNDAALQSYVRWRDANARAAK